MREHLKMHEDMNEQQRLLREQMERLREAQERAVAGLVQWTGGGAGVMPRGPFDALFEARVAEMRTRSDESVRTMRAVTDALHGPPSAETLRFRAFADHSRMRFRAFADEPMPATFDNVDSWFQDRSERWRIFAEQNREDFWKTMGGPTRPTDFPYARQRRGKAAQMTLEYD
ncbi:MAG: hypothetical protein WDO17_15580 [Alphaproteobacteria bacterium]